MGRTHTMTGAPTGDLIDLGKPYRRITVTVTAACWVRSVPYNPNSTTFTAPTAPTSTPAPAAGNESADGWRKLAANGQVQFGPEPYGHLAHRYLELWELAPGDLDYEGGH